MDTLILLEDDSEHTKNVKEGDIQNPDGITSLQPITSKLQMYDANAAKAALGDAAASLGGAYCNHIAAKIVEFADKVMQKDRSGPNRKDFSDFQIVIEFHQTNRRLAREITRAFLKLRDDKSFKKLSDKNKIAVRVHRVFLVSCESAGNREPNAKVSPKYSAQAANMQNAVGQGCITEKVYPPSNPPEYWTADVYTFGTGDIVTGSLTLNPNHLRFAKTPDWTVDKDGNIHPTPGGDPNKTEPSGGTIYRIDFNSNPGSGVVTPIPIGPSVEFNLLTSKLP